MDVSDDADNFARNNSVGRKTECEMPAERIFVGKVAFGQSFADERYGCGGRRIVFAEQTTAKQWNAHHGTIARTGGGVIRCVRPSRSQRRAADNLKSEGDAGMPNGQWI